MRLIFYLDSAPAKRNTVPPIGLRQTLCLVLATSGRLPERCKLSGSSRTMAIAWSCSVAQQHRLRWRRFMKSAVRATLTFALLMGIAGLDEAQTPNFGGRRCTV